MNSFSAIIQLNAEQTLKNKTCTLKNSTLKFTTQHTICKSSRLKLKVLTIRPGLLQSSFRQRKQSIRCCKGLACWINCFPQCLDVSCGACILFSSINRPLLQYSSKTLRRIKLQWQNTGAYSTCLEIAGSSYQYYEECTHKVDFLS